MKKKIRFIDVILEFIEASLTIGFVIAGLFVLIGIFYMLISGVWYLLLPAVLAPIIIFLAGAIPLSIYFLINWIYKRFFK